MSHFHDLETNFICPRMNIKFSEILALILFYIDFQMLKVEASLFNFNVPYNRNFCNLQPNGKLVDLLLHAIQNLTCKYNRD